MLRIWTFNPEKKNEIERFLSQQTYGKIITTTERQQYQLTSSKFSDIIFLLDEGLIFSPSFYGRKLPKAMHGYHPTLESQQGVLLFNQAIPTSLVPIKRTTDVYRLLSHLCNI